MANITYADSLLGTPQVTTSATSRTRDSLIAANEAVLVPEPATATLSLLALVGLAARRRRR
ncbi:MAG: PEP-CTERM sorting domain-containing protein [Akkermansiaceae bacterium]|nr:PEP-CTERM sorting domain-containing protein [Akkermansiaceae bacterium]